jgi:hypothetical protein
MLPFVNNIYHEFPKHILNFLPNCELAELYRVNSTINNITKKIIQDRKKIVANELIKYFYYKSFMNMNCITLRTKYDNYYKSNIGKFFSLLPEIFQCISEHNITYLDLSAVTSYGGYPEDICNMIKCSTHEAINIMNKLLILLCSNITLVSCNIGLFKNYIDRDELKNIISNKKTIKYISIHANGATTNFKAKPNTLYKIKDTYVWAHFDPNNI